MLNKMMVENIRDFIGNKKYTVPKDNDLAPQNEISPLHFITYDLSKYIRTSVN